MKNIPSGSCMSILEENTQVKLKNKNNWIYGYANNVTSQAGENGMIAKVFDVIGISNKYCVELGAGDGKYYSNVWPLIANEGWSSLLIESELRWFDKLHTEHFGRSGVQCLNEQVTIDGQNSLDSIFKRSGVPKNFDLLSIDIDGADWHLWHSLKFFNPRLVVIEFNPTIPSNVDFVQAADCEIQQGSSLRAMIRLAKEKGYEFIGATWLNAFFVLKDYLQLFKIEDNSISSMGFNVIGDQVFYLYDGTIVKTGSMMLPWQNIPLDIEDIQVLPKYERYFRAGRVRKAVLPASLKNQESN
jgi:hypothetical protein